MRTYRPNEPRAMATRENRAGSIVRRFALNGTGRGGRRQNPIRADHLRRATGLSVFGLLDYWGWPRRRLHSPRTERMTEKSAVTPSARSVQMKRKPPLRVGPEADPRPCHVDDGDAHQQDRREEDD